MNKKSHSQLLRNIIAFGLVAVVAIVAQYAIALGGSTKYLRTAGNSDSASDSTVKTFDFGPKGFVFPEDPTNPNKTLTFMDTTASDSKYKTPPTNTDPEGTKANLRLVGLGVFDNLIADNDDTGDLPSIFSNAGTKLTVGYSTIPSSIDVDLRVDGSIRASSLAFTGTGTKKLCADDFGVLHVEPSADYCEDADDSTSPQNGVCEDWSYEYLNQPASDNASGCITGTYSDTTDSSEYKWECQGANGGSTASCTADIRVLTHGECKPHEGSFYLTEPTNTAQGCLTGTYGNAVDSSTEWKWQCTGTDLAPVGCTAPKSRQTLSGTGCNACPNGSYKLTSPIDTDSSTKSGDVYELFFNRVVNADTYHYRLPKKVRKYNLYACELGGAFGSNDGEVTDAGDVRAFKKNVSGNLSIHSSTAICKIEVDEKSGTLNWDWNTYNTPWGLKEVF